MIRVFCEECPVTAECKNAGKNEPYGIWGGQTEKQRANIKNILKNF